MEVKTKYTLGDVLYLRGYNEEQVTGHIAEIQLKDYYGQMEVYYRVQVGPEVIEIEEENYGHDNGEPYYDVVAKVGNIHLKAEEE